jgi:hypothetical protein
VKSADVATAIDKQMNGHGVELVSDTSLVQQFHTNGFAFIFVSRTFFYQPCTQDQRE